MGRPLFHKPAANGIADFLNVCLSDCSLRGYTSPHQVWKFSRMQTEQESAILLWWMKSSNIPVATGAYLKQEETGDTKLPAHSSWASLPARQGVPQPGGCLHSDILRFCMEFHWVNRIDPLVGHWELNSISNPFPFPKFEGGWVEISNFLIIRLVLGWYTPILKPARVPPWITSLI